MMQTKTTVTRKMTVSAAQAWEAIAEFGRLDVWFPTISTCRVKGRGIGAVRRMDLARGGKIMDRIVDIQPEKMRLTYARVESPFPVSSYKGTVEVFESFDGLGVVVWTIDFESTPENAPVVSAQLEAGIGAGMEGMKADLAAVGSGRGDWSCSLSAKSLSFTFCRPSAALKRGARLRNRQCNAALRVA
jgi:uncharacterized protein YndB with AHSA1/START domain